MTKIVLLNEELGSQMQIYLALCDSYRVEIAENVESAMYLLRKMKPEILFLEYDFNQLKSNGKTGVDFIRKVKKKYTDLKVVTILDYKDRDVERSLVQNGSEVMYKPIKNKRLVVNVRRLAAVAA